jgi:hypothetical protein
VKIDNQALLDDVLEIISTGCTYRNLNTGEEITARPISDVIERLRTPSLGDTRTWEEIRAGVKPNHKTRAWKNVSDIDHDLNDSGFRYVYGRSGDWHPIMDNGSFGRKVAPYTTLVTV